jgi:proton-coupled amino acid transporter
MTSTSKPVNISSPRVTASHSGTPTPTGTPVIRALLRAQYSGTPPVPNIPARYTPPSSSFSNSNRGGSPGINLLSPSEVVLHRPSLGGISAKRPATPGAPESGVDVSAAELDDLLDEDKARVLRRHLVLHEERQSRADLRSLASSDQDAREADVPSAGPSTPVRLPPQRDGSEAFPIPYHAPGADVT